MASRRDYFEAVAFCFDPDAEERSWWKFTYAMQNPLEIPLVRLVESRSFERPESLTFEQARVGSVMWRRFQYEIAEPREIRHECDLDDVNPEQILVQPGLLQMEVGYQVM